MGAYHTYRSHYRIHIVYIVYSYHILVATQTLNWLTDLHMCLSNNQYIGVFVDIHYTSAMISYRTSVNYKTVRKTLGVLRATIICPPKSPTYKTVRKKEGV